MKAAAEEYDSPNMSRKGMAAEETAEGYDPNMVVWKSFGQAFSKRRKYSAEHKGAKGKDGGRLPPTLSLYGLLEGNPETWEEAKKTYGERAEKRRAAAVVIDHVVHPSEKYYALISVGCCSFRFSRYTMQELFLFCF